MSPNEQYRWFCVDANNQAVSSRSLTSPNVADNLYINSFKRWRLWKSVFINATSRLKDMDGILCIYAMEMVSPFIFHWWLLVQESIYTYPMCVWSKRVVSPSKAKPIFQITIFSLCFGFSINEWSEASLTHWWSTLYVGSMLRVCTRGMYKEICWPYSAELYWNSPSRGNISAPWFKPILISVGSSIRNFPQNNIRNRTTHTTDRPTPPPTALKYLSCQMEKLRRLVACFWTEKNVVLCVNVLWKVRIRVKTFHML